MCERLATSHCSTSMTQYEGHLNNFMNFIILQGNPVLICDNHLEEDMEQFASRRLLVPETVDCLKPLLTIIPLQLISYHLAGMKGVNVSLRENFNVKC